MFYVFLADGFEETEAVAPLDLLKRAGIEVRTVGVTGGAVAGTKGVRVLPELTPETAPVDERLEGVFLPGGIPGMENLSASQSVRDAVSYCAANGKLICAICAAPSVLGRMGLLRGRRAVCYPGFERELDGCEVPDLPVCVDGGVITAKGAGCVFPFAHAIITRLRGSGIADRVLAEIQYADAAQK